MCGIAGFIDQQRSRENAAHLIDTMCNVIRHRGPDEQGVWVGDGVALGMRRLAIIDVAGGQQPIFNEDRSILVVFNGEIYNYQQLHHELCQRGHQFQTTSDTEVLVHAYEEYGDDCVLHLRGMYTFAIWDIKRERLLAARDRFGKKPLNYYWDGQRLIFGSEIKSILEAGVPRAVNAIALDEYLTYQYVPAPRTLFQDIYKLPAAHLLIYEDGTMRTKRYWELPFTATCHDDEETAIERTRTLLQEAVQIRLMSEVPLGAFLSGGVDSSTIVGMMSQMLAQPVKTFSIGFEEDDFSELAHARQVAQHFGTDHHEFIVRPDLISVLPQLAWAYDEPFADASMLPTYYVSKLAREHVTVVLTGDGGDEIFGGYTRYERETAIHRIPRLLRSALGLGSTLLPEGMRGKKRFSMMRRDLPARYARTFTPFSVASRDTMYTPAFSMIIQQHDTYQWLADMFKTAPQGDIITQLQYVDVRSYLTDDILVKVDKASMFNSIETRAPLLDQQLAEYVASLQPSVRLRNGILKSLLKKVAADLLPAEILHRPKQGFGVPIKHWFRGELTGYAQDVLDSSRAHRRDIFQPQFIRNLLQAHANTTLVNHGDAIWALLCLEHWFQVYMDTPAIQQPTPFTVETDSSATGVGERCIAPPLAPIADSPTPVGADVSRPSLIHRKTRTEQ